MCNLYSNTLSQDAMRGLFNIAPASDKIGNQPPMPAIFPGYDAPVVRLDDDGNRELVSMKWGFVMRPKSAKTGKLLAPKAVNNPRDDKLSGRFWMPAFASGGVWFRPRRSVKQKDEALRRITGSS